MEPKLTQSFTELTQEEQEVVYGGAEIVNALAGISYFAESILAGLANGLNNALQGLTGGISTIGRGTTNGIAGLVAGLYYSLMSFYQ